MPGTSVELRVNVGCGSSPTPGYVNLDNSVTVRLASNPLSRSILQHVPMLGEARRAFLTSAATGTIRWAEATALPFATDSASVVYSSHMLEHLSREQAQAFLSEAFRILQPGGWLRLVVPDLRRRAESYLSGATGADEFVESLIMASPRPRTLLERATFVLTGPRHHLWMYDEASLGRSLRAAGFATVVELRPGETRLPDPGSLDLSERAEESIYLEAQKAPRA